MWSDPAAFLDSSSSPLCLTCSVPTTLASLRLLWSTQQAPASGPLHVLLFLRTPPCGRLPPFPPVSTPQSLPWGWWLLWPPSLKGEHHLPNSSLSPLLYFSCLICISSQNLARPPCLRSMSPPAGKLIKSGFLSLLFSAVPSVPRKNSALHRITLNKYLWNEWIQNTGF